MSYIERRKIKGITHLYFTKRISFMEKQFYIKKYVGLETPLFSKEKYILDNIEQLSNEELTFRVPLLPIIYSGSTLPNSIELKSIQINNLIEGKKCESLIDIEFAKEFIFNSNNIEGSKIPPEKVREIIAQGNSKYTNRNEVIEVQNSIKAYEYIKRSFKFTITSIKRLYYILTKGLFREGNIPYPKGFKTEEIVVGNSTTVPSKNVEEELIKLLEWYRHNKNKIHPFILAFEFHKRYEHIHPFSDGNGRTGRLIMNKILLSAGYPPIIVYKSNKLAYFNAFEKSMEGKIKNYYQFMLEQTDKTYDYLIQIMSKY
jgi:Fic family protein